MPHSPSENPYRSHVPDSDTLPEIFPYRMLQQLRVEKLAVFRALQLGDMLCAVPTLHALRTTLRYAHVTLVGLPWAARFAERFDDYIDDFVAFPGHPGFPEQPVHEAQLPAFYQQMRDRRFDLALQLQAAASSAIR
jgi:ADP-heptose:LPS heptosyltransferase